MRRLGKNTYAEFYFWGCNPGFLATDDGVIMMDTPQQPINAVRWREQLMALGPIRHLVNTEPHGDHISGNAYFPGVEVVGQVGLQARYLEGVQSWWTADRKAAVKQADPDSVWLIDHPDYPPNPPTRTFTDELTLEVGNHKVHCLNIPGHTRAQTAIFVPDDGVVFTGDNVFYKCKTFLQEGDPWEWLAALERIGGLDVQVIVPGHGEPCDRSYLQQQGEIIQNWVTLVEDYVRRGMTEDEAVSEPLDARKIDPYPMAQRLFPMDERVTAINIRNTYRQIVARQPASTT